MKNFLKHNWLKIIAILVLLFALGSHPYSYFQLLRWVVTAIALYSAYLANEKKDNLWMWIFAIIAILFNPLFPFYFAKDTWQILDVITAGFFLVSLFTKSKNNEQ